jgi:hypothetical protein
MDKLMGEPRFAQIWEEALQEFQKETEVNLVSNKSLPQAKSVDELIEYLRARHEEFQHDTASSSKCITYLRVAFGPFKLLNNTLGGASGAVRYNAPQKINPELTKRRYSLPALRFWARSAF